VLRENFSDNKRIGLCLRGNDACSDESRVTRGMINTDRYLTLVVIFIPLASQLQCTYI